MTIKEKIIAKALRSKFRKAIAEDLKHAKNKEGHYLSRWEVADAMTIMLGEEVTKSKLDNWTANSHIRHRFPVEYLPAFCVATGQRRALNLLLTEALPEIQLSIEINQVERRIKTLKNKKRHLEILKSEIS